MNHAIQRLKTAEAEQAWLHYSSKLKDLVLKVLHLAHEKLVLHPLAQKGQKIAQNAVLSLYKKCLPLLAQLSENSAAAAGLGLGVGVILTYWILSLYYANYYNSIIKTRLMSGVTFDHRNYKGLESISLRSDIIVPKISDPNQVLVRVHAASVDAADVSILSGYGRNERGCYKNRKVHVLGRDFSGVVLDVGRSVKNVEVGDAVWSALPIAANGSLSEFLVVDSRLVSLKPTHLSHDGAATLPYSCLKVWDALVNQGRVQPYYGLKNKSVLVVDGGSPTGCVAIQLAKAWEGYVTACVHHRVSPLAKLLGANCVIPIQHDPDGAEAKCRDLFEAEDCFFDVCIITAEDSSLTESFCREFSGIVLRTAGERRLPSDGYGFLRRRLLYYWRWLWPSNNYHRLDIKPLDHFKQLVETNKLQPVLDSAYAYEQAEEAFHATATTSNIGKTIITFGLRGHKDAKS